MIRKIFFFIEDIIWNIKCQYNLWLHGPYGLCRVVEKMPFRFLIRYLRKYGATIGDNCIVDSGFKIHRPGKKPPFKNLIIGSNVYIGHNVLLDLTDKIIIEDDSALSAGCQIWTHTGYYDKKLRDNKDYYEKTAPVIIKRSSVCYAKVVVNCGITIGERARIYALSVVNNSVPDNQIWAGIPAKYNKLRD